MKAGAKTYLFVGIVGASVSLMNIAVLLSGRGDLIDILAACVFTILSAEGFVSYLRMKGKTKFHFIS
jgi:uncharacterized membrane protein YiaA